MTPNINWDVISNIARGNVDVDDNEIKQIVQNMEAIKEQDFQQEPNKLFMLFKSTLNMYTRQEEELDEILQGNVDELDGKEREIKELRLQINDLKQMSHPADAAPSSANYYQAENRRLNDVLLSYTTMESDMRRDINALQDENRELNARVEEFDRNVKDITDENRRLKGDLREYRDIMESQQRERLDVKGTIDSEMRDKLTEKNNQISELLSQITDLEMVNRDLQDKSESMKQQMLSGQEDMEKMADEYEKMKKIIGVSDNFTDNLHRDNEELKMQVIELRRELKSKNDEEDAIVEEVNKKVQEWKARLAERDRDIREKDATINILQERITAANLDQDRIKMERLNKQLREKDEQVKRLQESLQQAAIDLETQSAIVEDLRKDSKTNREIVAYKKQITTLQAKIKQIEEDIQQARLLQSRAEDEAMEKDRKLNEAIKRIGDIESGEYGLSEAVHEIKECKNQLKLRDRNIEELTMHVNRLEEKLNDLLEENEEIRERIGEKPRDMADISSLRKSRALRQQQYRAENQILLKEIDRLEEERIDMKRQLRWQAQSATQRAMSEGLHGDDILQIEKLIDDLRRKRKLPTKQTSFIRFNEQSSTIRDENADKKLANLENENEALKQTKQVVMSENKSLKQALKEVYEELKNSNAKDGEVVQIPALERLINAIEVQQVHGNYEPSLHMKAQVDQLTGRNDELRKQLRQTRSEFTTAATENTNLKNKVDVLQNEIGTLSKLAEGKGGTTSIQTIPLPSNVEPKYVDIVNALNEQLQQVLHEVAKKESTISEITEALENKRRKLNVLREQNHLIYKEHLDEKASFTKQLENLKDEKKKLQDTIEDDKVRLNEFDRLLESLKSDPDVMKKRLAETTRKISLLRVNEKTLIRHHKNLEFSDQQNNVEISRLRNEILQMQKNVSERIGYLEQYKEMAAFKIGSLQKAMENSIPESDLESMNRRFDELTVKYRDLLQKENQFVAKNTKLDNLRTEVKILNEEMEALRSELAIEKEKRYTLGEALKHTESQLSSSTGRTEKSISKDSMNYELSSIMKKVTVLEMKELNERQRAEHASRMYTQVKSTIDELENRNSELEVKFTELTKLNLSSQQTERELRDELAAAVPKSVSDAERKKINSLLENEAKMKVRMSQLQDMADIAQNQLKTLNLQQKSREREMQSLRQQIREFQGQSDDKALIGKLHRQVLNLQTSDADAQLKLENAAKNIRKLEAHVLKLEKQIDEKQATSFHMQMEATSRSRQLKKTIQRLRQQFSGALPLPQQEKFSSAMISLQTDKATIREELRKVRLEREKLEDKLAEANIQRESLMELKKTIEDGKGAEKLTEWCNRMDVLRLQDMKLQRQVIRQKEELKYLENLTTKQEKTIASLEQDIIDMLKAQEMHQIEWEQRETDLERMLDQFSSQQREISRRAKKLQDVSELVPDPNLPIETQLTEALETINNQRHALKDVQAQNRFYNRDIDGYKDKIHDLEGIIISRDRVINELRQRIPDSSASPVIKQVKSEIGLHDDTPQQLKVAMEKIEMLKKQIMQKEDSLNRHKKLLEESRREQAVVLQKNEHQLSQMQRKLHDKTDTAFNKFRKVALEAITQKNSAPSSEHLKQMNDLEDLIKEQDIALETLMARVRAANEDIIKQKQMLNDQRRNTDVERNRLLEEHDREVTRYKTTIQEKNAEISNLEKELEVVKRELHHQKDASTRAPAVALRNLVERLKTQLKEKETKQQKLSNEIANMRKDLVAQAEANIIASNNKRETESAVNNLVQKKTAAYKDENDELQEKLVLLQRELKLERQQNKNSKNDVTSLQEKNNKKDEIIKKLKTDKEKLDSENERLRNKVHRLAEGKTYSEDRRQEAEKPSEDDAQEQIESSDDDGSKMEEVVEEITEEKKEVPQSSKLPRSLFSDDRSECSEIQKLKDEVKKLKTELEKKSQPSSKSAIEVAKWEIRKQWQSKLDQAKQKLSERETELKTAEKQNLSLRETISRLERGKQRHVPTPVVPVAEKPEKENPSDKHRIEELSSRLHSVLDENAHLRRENLLPQKKIVTEMETVNANLQERLESLEKELLNAGLRSEKNQSMAQLQRERDNQTRSRMLELASENTEYKFELEQAKIDIPRLKDRVHDQQQYIELLKSEKRDLQQKFDKQKSNQYRKGGMGTSGKSIPDLEKTIMLMKKVVERVQRENELLKKAPGVVSNDKMQNLKQENQMLKDRIDQMTQQIGGRLSERYESKTMAVERLVKENERLQKELKKEKNIRDKLHVHKSNLEATNNKLISDLEKTMNSARSPRRNNKDEQLRNLKSHLQEMNNKQASLLQENEHLMNQLEILKGTTFGSESQRSGGSASRELLEAREAIIRLSNEKKAAEETLEVFRKHVTDGDVPGTSQGGSANDSEKKELQNKVIELEEQLSNFNDEFFDEIEDLKYNYSEAVKQNVIYEEEIRQLKQQKQ